jgi:hypothetical protein
MEMDRVIHRIVAGGFARTTADQATEDFLPENAFHPEPILHK